MTVPVISAFVSQNPSIKITFVSRPFFKPFFEGIPYVNFFAVDLEKRHKGFFGLFQLYLDLKKLDVDAIADLHNVLRSKVIRTLFAFSGKKVVFTNKGRTEKKELTRSVDKIFKPLKSMVERHIDTFKELGFSIDIKTPIFPNNTFLSEAILKISGKNENFNWIGIAPFAQHKSKVYPKDLMQQVIDELALNQNNKIFLFGAKIEINKLNDFSKLHQNITVIAGKLSLEEELKLISNLNIMLSMDSANAHIAAMLGVKTITLWGATHPFAGFAPFNQPLENCLVADREKFPKLPTSIYGNKKVAGYEDTMRTILPNQVVEKINQNLKGEKLFI